MQRHTISRRRLFGQAAGLATATLLPMPAIAEVRQVIHAAVVGAG